MIRIAKLLRAANPVPHHRPGTPLDPEARAQLTRYVHASLAVDGAVLSPRARRTPWWVWAGVAVAGATAGAVGLTVLVPSGEPPANAQVIQARVLEAPAVGTVRAAAWETSTLVELDGPGGATRLVRVWSKEGDTWASEGEELVYTRTGDGRWSTESAAGTPLAYIPKITFSTDGTNVELKVQDGEASGSSV
ncbi:MAG: hypothetical protein LBJ08_09950, partial [Bifidobacteriaceae bacterium]|nr:hypothetical protein [Bifidobacteriaceae bacterium]